ncbi:MAG: CoA-binding protein [Dehalococcoidales bacterium]|nr:CoA-binding protein [Dehalococcoidales bacterium]
MTEIDDSDLLAARILKNFGNIAMVGVSGDSWRPSYFVFNYLTEHGYNVIPVNPTINELLGKKSYPSLSAVPEKVEVVDIFRRSGKVLPIVEEAIKIGAKAIWMQEGIVNEEAAKLARNAGLLVIMDRCMKKEHAKLAQKV